MSGSGIRRLITELRRRKVFRVAAVYAAVAFITLQAADLLVPALHLPPWTFSFLVLLALFGFPLAIVLAWAYEITPRGVRRTEPGPAPAAGAATRAMSAGPDLVALTALLVVIVAAGVSTTGRGSGADGKADGPLPDRSLAVLPVAHPGADDDYFSEGITEDIMTRLAGVKNLRVVSWTSVMPYRNTDKGVRQIGEELGVSHVVEVSVRRDGDALRIRVRLVDARDDRTVWSDQYDRRLENVFDVQAEIAEGVTAALETRFPPRTGPATAANPTPDTDAYDLLLRGREQFHRNRPDANALAIALYRQALELDSDFAEAHAALAQAYGARQFRFGDGLVWLDSAETTARRALALDPNLAKAHRLVGIARYFSGRPRDALPYFERALELQPGSPEAMNSLGLANFSLGRTDEAVRWLRRSARDRSMAPVAWTNLAGIYLQLELYERAEQALGNAMAEGPDWPVPRIIAAWADLLQGRHEEATDRALRLAESEPDNARALLGAAEILVAAGELEQAEPVATRAYALSPFAWNVFHYSSVLLAHVLMERGETDRAARLLDEFVAHARGQLDRPGGNDRIHYPLAAAYALRGEIEEAIHHLDEAVQTGWRYHPVAVTDPLLESLRHDPRYHGIVDRLAAIMDDFRARVEADEAG
jgi:TolB-like protein/tetratricopeptide (TPR) repeat protein